MHLRGGLRCDAETTIQSCDSVVLTLPERYRPATTEVQPGWTSGSSFDGDEFHNWAGFARISIARGGTLSVAFPRGTGFFEVQHLSLDGLTFRAL